MLVFIRSAALLLVSIGVFGASVALASAAPRETSDFVSANNCLVEKPKAWGEGGRYVWLGACRNGYAQDYGVIRNTLPDNSIELFLGRTDRGRLVVGALKSPSGYTVGKWRDGTVLAIDDDIAKRNAIDDGFQAAATAARATSKQMASRSNRTSQKYYADLAKEIDLQLR
jgi:hypothetical protein